MNPWRRGFDEVAPPSQPAAMYWALAADVYHPDELQRIVAIELSWAAANADAVLKESEG